MVLARWRSHRRRPRATRFEQIMAALALVNLILVLYDLSYLRFRDRHLQLLPQLTRWYGEQFKGIEPEQTTTEYLALTDELAALVREQGLTRALSADLGQQILAQLRAQSEVMIEEDPFAIAGKSGTLVRIKNQIRKHTGLNSSKAAFRRFWSSAYLNSVPPEAGIEYFQTSLRPLIATNYYRAIGENGRPIDRFWLIDLGFMGLFAAEFLTRTYVLSRRHPTTRWGDAMLWRLYDLPLFLGFWRWLRIIPVTLRLHQARWVNLEPARNRLSRALVSQFAVELTEIVTLRILDQAQQLIQRGDLKTWIRTVSERKYVDINGIDEIQTIAKHFSDVVVYQVLPKIKPELEALLKHSLVSAMQQAPAYQGLKYMPGFETLATQISQQVVVELSSNLTNSLQTALRDQRAAELTSQLLSSFGHHLSHELQSAQSLAEVKGLLYDLLEEIKINYVEGIAAEDWEQLQASRYRLYGASQRPRDSQ